MSKKPEAALKAVGLYVGMNAFVFVCVFVLRWLFGSSIGHWLELDKPTKPYVPGSLFVMQIFFLIIAFYYYRDKVKGD